MKELTQEELIFTMGRMLAENPNQLIFVKFTCLNCGSRQTCDTPNKVFGKGYSCEKCGKVTYPKKFGMLVMKSNVNLAEVQELIAKEKEND